MADDPANVATTYFDAWKANDFDTMRSLVADDVRFEGPLATLEGAEDYMEGIRRLSRVISDIVIRKVFVDGQDVLTWYDMHTTGASPGSGGQLVARRGGQDHYLASSLRRARTRPVESGLPRINLLRTPLDKGRCCTTESVSEGPASMFVLTTMGD